MKLLLSIAVLVLVSVGAMGATVNSVSSTNVLKLLNPHSVNTNTFSVGDTGSVGDGTAAVWTYDIASAVPEDAYHIKPLLYNGRWVRNLTGGTNVSTILTNVTVLNSTNYTILGRSNITVTVSVSGTNVTFILDAEAGGTNITTIYSNSLLYLTNSVFLTFSGTNYFIDSTLYLSNIVVNLQGTNTDLTQLWTNNATSYQPTTYQAELLATNIVGAYGLTALQQFTIAIGTNLTVTAGTNQVSIYQVSNMRIASTEADPANAIVQLGGSASSGQFLLIENTIDGTGFSLLNGSEFFDDALSHLILKGGDWLPTAKGDGIFLLRDPQGMHEAFRFPGSTNVVSGDSLWELVSGHMRTVPPSPDDWQFRFGGTPVTTLTKDAYLHLTGPSFSEVQLDGPTAGSMIDIYNDDSTAYVHFQSPLGAGFRSTILEPTQPENTPGSSSPFWFGSIATYTNNPLFALFNGTNAIVNQIPTLSFGPDARIGWGAGGTNELFRFGQKLIYSNNVPYLQVQGADSNNFIGVYLSSGTVPHIGASAGVFLDEDFVTHNLQPNGTYSVGLPDNSGGAYYRMVTKTNYVVGVDSGSGNHSWLATYHDGTTGFIHFTSEAAGTGGDPRPFEINRNIAAEMSVGPTTYVDMNFATQTNLIAGAMTFLYCTNGAHLADWTHKRVFLNNSGSDQTVNLPSGWHKGVGAGSSFVVTNGTVAQLFVNCMGQTSSSALQTNAYASVAFYP